MKMIERIRRLKPAVLVQPGSVTRLMSGLLCLGLASCGDGPSNSDVEKAIKSHLASKPDFEHCLPIIKIKQTSNPEAFVLAEEAFLNWEMMDGLIIGILLGDGYINVRKGGYNGSMTKTGTPGAPYEPKSREELWRIFEEIRQNGAVTRLTDKGKSVGVWKEGTACLKGRWLFQEVMNHTDPAPDKDGKIVSHINVKLKLEFVMISDKPIENKYDSGLTKEFKIKGEKYSDGWQFYEWMSG